MSNDQRMDIGDRLERLEAIAEKLEDGSIDLQTARDLREEADAHLEALRDGLAVGDGEVIEIEESDIDVE